MRKSVVFLFSLAFGIVLFIFALKAVNLNAVSSAICSLFVWKFLFIFLVILFTEVFIDSLKWRVIIKTESEPEKIIPGVWKVFIARLIGFSISYLTPAVFFGGEPFRIFALKENEGPSSEKLIVSIVLDKLLLAVVSFVFFFLGLFTLFYYLHFPLIYIFGLFLSFLSISALLIFLYSKLKNISLKKGIIPLLLRPFHLKTIEKNGHKISQIEKDIFYFFEKEKSASLQVIGLATLEVILLFLAYWLIMFYSGKPLEIGQLFAINSMIYLAYVIPFPAALGSFEVGQAFAFKVFGFSTGTGIAFSLVVRAVNLMISALGLGALAWLEVKILVKRVLSFFSKISNRL